MNKLKYFIPCTLLLAGCKKDPDSKLLFQFSFDETQERLDNLGQPAAMPAGHAALTPDFHGLSAHFIELSPDMWTALGSGELVYKGAETEAGSENAIDFDKAVVKDENQIAHEILLKDVAPGTYKYIRVSVSYQNYDIQYNIRNINVIGDLMQQSGRVASFVGFNTYITETAPKDMTLIVDEDKKQGFWIFETAFSAPYNDYNQLQWGEAPAGATTVVNPIAATSPVPAGSCVVTGEFLEPLVITGDEKKDITVTLSFSVNQSFEWEDTDSNGQWDVDASNFENTEKIQDMGLRGLKPSWE